LSPLDGETVSLRRFSNDAEVAGEETGVVERGLSGRNSTPCLVQHFCPFPLCLGYDALGYEAGARIFTAHTIHRQTLLRHHSSRGPRTCVAPTFDPNGKESHVTPTAQRNQWCAHHLRNEYVCVKGIAVVALFGGVVGLVEALQCDIFLRGSVETCWLGWQFLYAVWKQRWQAGLLASSLCA